MANIMLGSFLNGLSRMTGFTLHMEPPAFAADMSAALMGSLMAEALYGHRELLAIQTTFCVPDRRFQGFFLYLPEVGSLDKLFQVLGI
ncbi:MAG: hypothetical protein C4336_07910 [Armatimonadota bacterium]